MAAVGPKVETVFLMTPEESGLLSVPSQFLNITTATFFKGKVPAEDLKRRIIEIVQANPWLACRLKKQVDDASDKNKKFAMVYDAEPQPEVIMADHYKEYSAADAHGDKEKKLSAIDVGQAYEVICKAVDKIGVIKTGSQCVGKNEPQFRVTVVPSTDGERFALLVSMSHVIADGYTYYEILNLLSLNVPMKVLNPIRKPGFTESLITALGEKECAFPMSGGYMLNAIGNMMFGPKPKIRAHFIDKDKVSAQKAKVKEVDGVPFVSTNDIVTSAFGKLTQTNVLEMAINMRDRLPDFTKTDAGNLEFALYYRPEDYATPLQIRQSITGKDGKLGRHCAGSSTKLPGFWGSWRKRIALLTNWSSNHTGEFALGDGCVQELHLPIYASAPLEFGIIFKPTPSTLALMTWSRHIKKGAFQQRQGEDGVFGELVSDSVFSR